MTFPFIVATNAALEYVRTARGAAAAGSGTTPSRRGTVDPLHMRAADGRAPPDPCADARPRGALPNGAACVQVARTLTSRAARAAWRSRCGHQGHETALGWQTAARYWSTVLLVVVLPLELLGMLVYVSKCLATRRAARPRRNRPRRRAQGRAVLTQRTSAVHVQCAAAPAPPRPAPPPHRHL